MSATRALTICFFAFVASVAWAAAPSLDSLDPGTGFVMLGCVVLALVVLIWPQPQKRFHSDARKVRR